MDTKKSLLLWWWCFGLLVTVNEAAPNIVVVGSLNADVYLPVDRLPVEGENLCTTGRVATSVGGKGCTQAVAAHRLGANVTLIGQVGKDSYGKLILDALKNLSTHITSHEDFPTGTGYVFLLPQGQVSAVVVGGANEDGWIKQMNWEFLLNGADLVMLQCEIPAQINTQVAECAQRMGIPVCQDVGGADRLMEHQCDYCTPNESELERLCRRMGCPSDGIIERARFLQNQGTAQHILVTRGGRGSLLLLKNGTIIEHPAISVPEVIDETGAGDAFRAAFAVSLALGQSHQECLDIASRAGAWSVQHQGAMNGAPWKIDLLKLRGGGSKFPWGIGSRINSMKDRPDLWEAPLTDVREWIRRQASVDGITCVDLNFPQHFHTWTNQQAKAFLDMAGLKAGAVCLRYPSEFARGALHHPTRAQEAIELTKQACQAAIDLGAPEVVIWSAFDGYDYPFQASYEDNWDQLVLAFQQVCDAFPSLKISVEFKPTDENTRFFTIPSTGAAILMCRDVDRPNFGLTLDVGHMLMAGENPGQSISMVGGEKLFGVQLNDGYTRLAAEDGLAFGSVHPGMALEIMWQLQRVGFTGHVYFDTFPQRSNPCAEAAYNIKRVKAFYRVASQLDGLEIRKIQAEQDGIRALELIDTALKKL